MRSILKSPAMRATAAFGLGGLGFAVGNLLLARSMSAVEYAFVALVIAFGQLSAAVGPVGVETLVNRYPSRPSAGLVGRVCATATLVALALTIVGMLAYEVGPILAAAMAIICVGVALNRVAGAIYQSREAFGSALLLMQFQNVILLTIGAFALALPLPLESAVLVCAILAATHVLVSVWGWLSLRHAACPRDAVSSADLPWREGVAIVGQNAAVGLLIQIERFAIPLVLSVESLATFAVLAAIVGSPFRVLQMGVGFAMLPRLRAAKTLQQRKRIMLFEATLSAAAIGVSIALILLLTPWILELFLGARYMFSPALLWAAILGGIAKVVGAFAVATILALGSERQIAAQSGVAWASVAVAAAGAVIGANWGLAGVVGGVAFGWFVKAAAAVVIGRHLIFAQARTIVAPAMHGTVSER